MDNRVVIEYRADVPASQDQPAHLAGERFVVTDAAAAKELHPQAAIVSYADARPFVATQDEALVAFKDAEKAERARLKAEAEAAKAAAAEQAAKDAAAVEKGK